MPPVNVELKAKDIMSPDPVCVAPSTRIRELARVFEENEISGVPVVNEAGKVIGVVSKTDLIRRCSEGTDEIPPSYLFEILSERGDEAEASRVIPEPLVCVEDFMTGDPLMVDPELPVSAVAKMMYDKHIHRVIVADVQQYPIGIITSMDLLGAYSRPQGQPRPA